MRIEFDFPGWTPPFPTPMVTENQPIPRVGDTISFSDHEGVVQGTSYLVHRVIYFYQQMSIAGEVDQSSFALPDVRVVLR